MPPKCTPMLFLSVMCVLVLYAASSGRPSVVQYCHQLLFHWKRFVERALLPVEEAHPGVPRLLVGAAQIAEVVDLEPGGTALVRRLEHQVLSADLAELELLGVAVERRAIRVERQAGVGPLVVVHGVRLEREDAA